MRVNFGKKSQETIASIMAPINAITEKLTAFKAQAEADAVLEDEKRAAAEKAAADLRAEAVKAQALIEKYS